MLIGGAKLIESLFVSQEAGWVSARRVQPERFSTPWRPEKNYNVALRLAVITRSRHPDNISAAQPFNNVLIPVAFSESIPFSYDDFRH